MRSYTQVCFMGLGYIGLPTAATIASIGQNVLGVDINEKIVSTINNGAIHIIENGLAEVVKKAVQSKKLRATTIPELSDVYLIVVPTPFTHNFQPDISFVRAATKAVIPLLKKDDLFIIESTSPVGTTEKIAKLIYSIRPELKGEISIAYCPERVLPGNVLYELINNDRVIGGIDNSSSKKAAEFYSTFVRGQLHQTNCKTAELCKLTENSSRDVQIAFANELSIICDKAGIDVWELINLANKHPRVKILQPGSGVGGHCIAVDPYFITADFPRESLLIAQARETNNYKAMWCVEKIKSAILEFEKQKKRKPSIAFMGLAFKPNIDDLRESSAIFIVEKILEEDNNCIYICEPNVNINSKYNLSSIDEAYDNSDIVAFLVKHDMFKTLPKNENKIELDFCGVRK